MKKELSKTNLMYKEIVLIGSSKIGGINTYVESLHKAIYYKKLKVRKINNSSDIFKFIWFYICNRKNYQKSARIVVITWGVYNLIPFNKKNHICIFHGFPSIRQQGLVRFILNLLTIIICKFRKSRAISISKYVHSILLDIYGLKTIVVRNSLPYLIYKSPKIDNLNLNKDIDLTFIGRPTKFKLPEEMIYELKNLADKGYKISIIGHSNYLNRFKPLLKESNIILLGNMKHSDISSILVRTKIVLNCSDSEPFGLIFLEALFNYCSIISPRSGGALEIYSLLSNEFSDLVRFYDNLRNSRFTIEALINDINSKNIQLFSKNDIRKEIITKFSPLDNATEILKVLNESYYDKAINI